VGSSSLREELFNTYLKAKTSKATGATPLNEEPSHQDTEEERDRARQKKEKAVKEREEKVMAERRRVEADIGRSRMSMNMEEDEGIFRCADGIVCGLLWRSCCSLLHCRTMLTDAIRDPQVRIN
jgi:hypothetical protein